MIEEEIDGKTMKEMLVVNLVYNFILGTRKRSTIKSFIIKSKLLKDTIVFCL